VVVSSNIDKPTNELAGYLNTKVLKTISAQENVSSEANRCTLTHETTHIFTKLGSSLPRSLFPRLSSLSSRNTLPESEGQPLVGCQRTINIFAVTLIIQRPSLEDAS
jgi:hypothetical protein